MTLGSGPGPWHAVVRGDPVRPRDRTRRAFADRCSSFQALVARGPLRQRGWQPKRRVVALPLALGIPRARPQVLRTRPLEARRASASASVSSHATRRCALRRRCASGERQARKRSINPDMALLSRLAGRNASTAQALTGSIHARRASLGPLLRFVRGDSECRTGSRCCFCCS